MASVRALVLLFLTAVAGAGCATAFVREDRSAPTGLAPGDAIAILLSSSLDDERLAELEQTLAGCLRAGLGHGYATVRIVSSKEFFDHDAAQKAEGQSRRFTWDSLAGDPVFYRRIAALKLRYLIVINAQEGSRLTDAQWSGGSKMLGLPGPLVNWSWQNSALLEAIVLDVKGRRLSGSVQALAIGKSGAGLMLLVFPFPIPVPYVTPSFPQSAACRGFGDGLAKFLTGESPAEGEAGAAKSGGQSMD